MPKSQTGQPRLFAIKRQGVTNPSIDLQIMAARLPKPEHEYKFALSIGRQYRADRAWPEYKILFEIEGGTFGNLLHASPGSWMTVRGEKKEFKEWTEHRLGGRHNIGIGMDNDCQKYDHAAILGWLVIRATTKMITNGQAIELLEAAFTAKGYTAPRINDSRNISTR